MKNPKSLLATLILASVMVFGAGCSNVREIGQVNGVNLTRVTTRGVFSPATTTVLASSPERPGEVEVLTTANGQGVLPAVANAAGIAGGAALLRPARTTVENHGGNSSSGSTATGTGNGGNGGNGGSGGGGFIPPGHINNPGHGPGNGNGNN